MQVYLNNEVRQTRQEDLSAFLQEQALHETTGIAVAVNEEVIPRAQWSTCLLHEKDSIIIITATQGG